MSIRLGNTLLAGTPDISGKANTDLDNLTSTGKNIGNWSSNVSNCITYIPQDIKLELNSGTLTLKAGSKVYVPNGFEADGTTPKFDVVIIDSDKTVSGSRTGNALGMYNFTDGVIDMWGIGSTASGATQPTISTTYCIWYDTTNNVFKVTENAGSTWTTKRVGLPMCVLSYANSAISSIDQIFNGFGYIGSTVFALPDVKGLMPNGRNADGTLNNTEFTVEKVLATTLSSTLTTMSYVRLNSSEIYYATAYISGRYYDEEKNYNYLNDTVDGMAWVGFVGFISGKIDWFNPRTVFHALDWNESSEVSGWSMPSSKYIDLTLLASGSTYTAPANGYYALRALMPTKQAINMSCSNGLNPWIFNSDSVARTNGIFLPVKKGEVMTLGYGGTLSNPVFRFVYADGEVE